MIQTILQRAYWAEPSVGYPPLYFTWVDLSALTNPVIDCTCLIKKLIFQCLAQVSLCTSWALVLLWSCDHTAWRFPLYVYRTVTSSNPSFKHTSLAVRCFKRSWISSEHFLRTCVTEFQHVYCQCRGYQRGWGSE